MQAAALPLASGRPPHTTNLQIKLKEITEDPIAFYLICSRTYLQKLHLYAKQ
jgi:hypothetical protein